MKKVSILCFFGFLFSTNIFAGELLSVKITSFRAIDTSANLAEACGQVTIASSPAIASVANLIAVTVTSDPGHDPGQYTVLADPHGAFCTVVATSYGQAEATAWIPNAGASSKSEIVKLSSRK